MSDFFATFIEVAGLNQNQNIDGVSFLPMIRGEKSPRSWAYSESKQKWWVRNKAYKLYNNGKFVEVSSTDPGKETSLNMPLNNPQQKAFKLLGQARPHRSNP